MEKVIANIPKLNYPLIEEVKGGRERNVNNDTNKAYQKNVLQ